LRASIYYQFFPESGKRFQPIKTVLPTIAPREPGPMTSLLAADSLKAKGRYVRIRAANFGTLPDWIVKQPTPAWLFVDEVEFLSICVLRDTSLLV
jgi:hypothetical protein